MIPAALIVHHNPSLTISAQEPAVAMVIAVPGGPPARPMTLLLADTMALGV
jgi:hypothetical protein